MVNQVELHPFFTQGALREFHKANGIVTQAWSPLGGVKRYRPAYTDAVENPLEHPTIVELAAKHGKTPAQLVLRWHVEHDVSATPKSVNLTASRRTSTSSTSRSRPTRSRRSTASIPERAAAATPSSSTPSTTRSRSRTDRCTARRAMNSTRSAPRRSSTLGACRHRPASPTRTQGTRATPSPAADRDRTAKERNPQHRPRSRDRPLTGRPREALTSRSRDASLSGPGWPMGLLERLTREARRGLPSGAAWCRRSRASGRRSRPLAAQGGLVSRRCSRRRRAARDG
jgi:hypothetical protein